MNTLLRIILRGRWPHPMRTLRHRGLEEGILGGKPGWLIAGGAAWALWLVEWAWRKQPEVVYRTVLKPGEKLEIVSGPVARPGARKQSA